MIAKNGGETVSIRASLIYMGMKLSGIKKVYRYEEEKFLHTVRKMNRSRGFYMPRDKKAFYSDHMILGKYHCLIIQNDRQQAKRAILYFFGGGMMLGSDKGDVRVIRKLAKETGCDIWFPDYPLCTDHCITESYDMAFECYRQMIVRYGAGNVSTCGFSSGGALAIGIALHNNAIGAGLPQPRHIVAVSPGEVPWNHEEKERMKRLNGTDVMVDYAFMSKVDKFMRHGVPDVPEYMISTSRGDYTGIRKIYFFYSSSEVLYGVKEEYLKACRKYGVDCEIDENPNMVHCYCMLPYFPEAKEAFGKIAGILRE